MSSRFKFFDEDEKSPSFKQERVDTNPAVADKLPSVSPQIFKEGIAKYRSEQMVVVKIDGIIENHADTKLEYTVDKKIESGKLLAKVELVDQIVNMHPAHLQDDFELMSKIDIIKSNALLRINPLTGKIISIENIEEIRKNWFDFKNVVKQNSGFVKSKEMKDGINTYLESTELQFTEENLLQDFQIRPFFSLFFDRYLVTDDLDIKDYTHLYYSQLFDRLPVELNIKQTIVNETPEIFGVIKNATLNKKNLDLREFEKIYDLKYKPRIGYKFDNYNFEHYTQVDYNLKANLLEDAAMTISEEVKNNIEVFVDYKVRRLS